MVNFQCKDAYGYADLLEIMRILRAPGGCPWDQAQTHASLRRNLLEEACEAAEAIDREDRAALCEELGDVLLQVVFHAQLEQEQGGFTMDDVIDGICKKLIFRHPHVFGTGAEAEAVHTADAVLPLWEARKRQEKGLSSTADAVDAVSRTLPALWRAEKIEKKVSQAGFDWASPAGALDKLSEEVEELRQAVEAGAAPDAPHGVREELGDVLLAAAKVAQITGVDPEEALHGACDKFAGRFRKVEAMAGDRPLNQRTEAEIIDLWTRAK